ncbi:MAG: DNA ligase (NAD(+)) LigA, partial [Spirochaetaceae bacterium]|nr:DNA ligase (NAD(+)) LigA [Spirochaetaceae bacterium]
NTLEELRAASVERLAAISGIGEKIAKAISEGLAEAAADMDAVLAAGIISIGTPAEGAALPLKGLSFCFTGELRGMKRDEAKEKVKALGGSVKSSVVKELSFLVANDPLSNSNKNNEARKLGIPVIDEAEFLRKIAS